MPPLPPPPPTPKPVELDLKKIVPNEQKKSAGPIVGTVIIVVILLLGGLYYWGAKLNSAQAPSDIPYIPNGTTTITVTQ